MTYVIAFVCFSVIRRELERAYFCDLLDDGETAPDVYIVGAVQTKRDIEQPIWRGSAA